MRRQDIQRRASVLILGVLLLSGLAIAGEAEAPEVPEWAEGWKQTWLEAYKQGSLRVSTKLTPRYLGPGRQDVFAVLELRSLDFPPGDHPPASVALVIDRSASTAGRRLLISRKTALSVIDGLSDNEHLAIIAVSDRPDVLPVVPLTPENRAKMKAYVSKLTAEGRSDLSAGIDAANEELASPSESNFYRQVIVISDGRPTDGMVDQDGLAELAREAREDSGIHTNTVAVGEDADIALMAGMAKQGWGFASNLNDSSAVERVSKRRQLDLVRRAANAVELRVRVGPTVTLLDVMGLDATTKGNLARIPVGEVGPGEVIRIVLHLSTDNVGKQVRPIDLAKIDLEYEDALIETRRIQNLQLQAELNPARAHGRGALNLEALRPAARAYVEKHTARADETAEDGDPSSAQELLGQTLESVKQMGALARLEISDALALFHERSSQIVHQRRPELKPDPLAEQEAKNKKKKR